MYDLSGSYVLRVSKAFGGGLSSGAMAALQMPGLASALVADSVRLSDGSFVAVGTAMSDSSLNNTVGFIAKFRADGSVDTGFGLHNGFTIFDLSSNSVPNILVFAVALDSAGRILVSGMYVGGNLNSFVARFTAAGELDTGFNSMGWRDVYSNLNASFITALAVDSADNIYAGLNRYDNLVDIYKIKPDGTLDLTYGNVGRTTLTNNGYVWDLAMQPDGRLLVAGRRSTEAAFWLVPPNGYSEIPPQPDYTEGLDGQTFQFYDSVPDGSGGFYFVGTINIGESDSRLLIQRVIFNVDTWVKNAEPGHDEPAHDYTIPSLAMNANGQLLVMYQPDADSVSAALFEYKSIPPAIELVSSFGVGGKVGNLRSVIGQAWGLLARSRPYSTSSGFRLVGSAVEQPLTDDNISQPAIGFLSNTGSSLSYGPLLRISATGTQIQAAALDPAGCLVVAGQMRAFDGERRTFVARYLKNGQPDQSFGNGRGVLLGELGSGPEPEPYGLGRVREVHHLLVDDNGVIIVGGTDFDSSAIVVVVTPDGSQSFSASLSGASMGAMVLAGTDAVWVAVLEDTINNVYKFTYTVSANPTHVEPSTLPDTSLTGERVGNALALPGSKVLWYGDGLDDMLTTPYCVIFDLSESDTSAVVDTSGLTNVRTTAATRLRDGSIMLAGRNEAKNPVVYRLQPDALAISGYSWDSSFGDHGVVTAARTDVFRVQSLQALPDGSLYLGGTTGEPASLGPDTEVFVLRLTADGVFDSSLGTQGHVIPGMVGGGFLNLSASGDLWVSGYRMRGFNLNLAVAAAVIVR